MWKNMENNLCAIHHYKKKATVIYFIPCMMGFPIPYQAMSWASVADQLDQIEGISASDEGYKLSKEKVEVPWGCRNRLRVCRRKDKWGRADVQAAIKTGIWQQNVGLKVEKLWSNQRIIIKGRDWGGWGNMKIRESLCM